MAETIGQQALRDENINRAVIGFALQNYKFKQITMVQSSSSWRETFFKEGADELTAKGTRDIKGVSRLSRFPFIEPNWEETSVRHLKHAAEGVVSFEDAITDSIDVMQRTILRISRAITKSVDDAIYAAWIADADINTAAAVANWNDATESNQKPVTDILHGIRDIGKNNYDALENGWLLLNLTDYAQLMLNSKVINNPSFKTSDIVSNGRVGQIAGLNIVVSNSVPDDEALIIIGQLASTWKTASALKSVVIEDPQIKFTIRASEIGVTMVTNPKAIHRITGTKA